MERVTGMDEGVERTKGGIGMEGGERENRSVRAYEGGPTLDNTPVTKD
jgi:hypothetical protein